MVIVKLFMRHYTSESLGRGRMKVSFFTGSEVGGHYELGLLSGLVSKPLHIDVIGSNAIMHSHILQNANITLLNYFGDKSPNVSIKKKASRIIKYYFRIIRYTLETDSRLFHVQSINKFVFFDRTLLMIFYKMFRKKIIFTAHNIDREERDGKNTWGNRLSLYFLYKIVDHLIVHTDKMKLQLIENFDVPKSKITVIAHGIMDVVPKTNMTTVEAREKINLTAKDKVILFFGKIAPYKGLEYLILALSKLVGKYSDLRVVLAGNVKDCKEYWEDVQRTIQEHGLSRNIIYRIEYIPDEEVEIYFKSADVLIIPYKHIFQSGVIFLSYNFGLPVIATDVGSLREDIIEGRTGFICKPESPDDLAEKIETYFHSDLYRNLKENRSKIIQDANEKYSWGKIGEKTYSVYTSLA